MSTNRAEHQPSAVCGCVHTGCDAFPAPSGKERFGFNKLAPPVPEKEEALLLTVRRRRDVNTLMYNTEAQKLRIRVSLARFANSKRVRGASLGRAPSDSEVPLKYSLLALDWVPRSTPAPTPAELLARHPAPQWLHY